MSTCRWPCSGYFVALLLELMYFDSPSRRGGRHLRVSCCMAPGGFLSGRQAKAKGAKSQKGFTARWAASSAKLWMKMPVSFGLVWLETSFAVVVAGKGDGAFAKLFGHIRSVAAFFCHKQHGTPKSMTCRTQLRNRPFDLLFFVLVRI